MSTTAKKKATAPQQVDLTITKIKVIAKKNRVPFNTAIEIMKFITEAEKNESTIELNKKQIEMVESLQSVLGIGIEKLKEILENKENFQLNPDDRFGIIVDDELEEGKTTVGSIVHFYPNEAFKQKHSEHINGASYLPAIVTQHFSGNNLNLHVLLPLGDTVVKEMSVMPGSLAQGVNASYWLTKSESRRKFRKENIFDKH